MKRTALLLSLLLPLAACNRTSTPEAATPAAEAPAASTSVSAAAEAAAAAANAAPAATPAAAATTAQPAAVDPAAAATAASTGAPLVAGTDYELIQGGQPFEPLNGKIEVVEVFNYICPACFRFQPLLSTWLAARPADVRFTQVAAPFGPEWIPYAHAFYVAQSMGLVDKTSDAVFNAIHVSNTLPGEGKTPDDAAIAKFYGQYGADPKQFLDAMHSFAVDAKVNRGKQFMTRSGVQSTPTLVIDGKYRVLGKSYEDMLRIATQLIAQERAAAAAGG